MNQPALSSFIWSVADLLRGDYKQSDYGKVILPFTVLRRLDCVLEKTKAKVLTVAAERRKAGGNPHEYLRRTAKVGFYNTSPMDLKKLLGDPDHIRQNLEKYVEAFSPETRDIFERFEFDRQVERLAKAGLLYQVTEKFAGIDLHPEKVDNHQMGLVFEELIRKFAELSNETAGEHFTPREVIRLMVNLIFFEDDDSLSEPGVVRTLYDPTAGTGGMLSVAGEHLAAQNPGARLAVFGQELNPESYAICKADMLIKGQDVSQIHFGNTLSDDGHPGERFDYMLANPPFGVEWKKVEKEVRQEHEQRGFEGRFGPGLPRVSDGSMLFLLHMLSKMRPVKDGGCRFGIVLNGSPLFTGGAGSGESEIRRYVLENDLLEAIVGLPTDMFYNTGISTYVWIVGNKKPAARKGKVQLIDASAWWQKMRKSLGSKRKELSDAHIERITMLFGDFREESENGKPVSRILRNEAFGYRTITVERPLKDEQGKPVLGTKGKQKGKLQPNPALRDTENVPLTEDVEKYFEREVLPHAPDAWIDEEATKIGYEVTFSRCFFVAKRPRPLHDIDVDLQVCTRRVADMISRLSHQSAGHAANTEATVRGLDLRASLKTSGIDWLGEIPAHWTVGAVRKFARLESGHTPSRSRPEFWTNCNVPWFTLADVWQIREGGADYVSETEEKISQLGLENSSARLLPKGTVILSRTASVGFSAIMGVDMATSQDFANWVCGPRLMPEFLLYSFRAMKSEFTRLMMGSTHNTIYMPDIQSLHIALPPLEEQKAIVEQIRSSTVEIDALIGEAERAVAFLNERRSALISAAVTGHASR